MLIHFKIFCNIFSRMEISEFRSSWTHLEVCHRNRVTYWDIHEQKILRQKQKTQLEKNKIKAAIISKSNQHMKIESFLPTVISSKGSQWDEG
jgi:hypothetical protein